MRTLFVVVLVLLGATIPSFASGGDQLLKICHAAVKSMDEDQALTTKDKLDWIASSIDGATCAAYLAGFWDGESATGTKGSNTLLFCPPPHTTNGQLARVVYKYLNEHPEKLSEDGAALVVKAFTLAFPCPENKKVEMKRAN
jgi:hypothetical protein